jgi:hypothetical protein
MSAVGTAPDRPLRLELVGLFPELFSMCVSCCTTDEFGRCGISLDADQLRDYPPDLVARHAEAAELFTELLAEFQGRVAVIVTGLMSPRGAWLAVRHRLPTGVTLFLEGRRLPMRLDDRLAIRAAVAAALDRHRHAATIS